jgi:hypothetical protein
MSIISEEPTNQIRGHLFQDECSVILTTEISPMQAYMFAWQQLCISIYLTSLLTEVDVCVEIKPNKIIYFYNNSKNFVCNNSD